MTTGLLDLRSGRFEVPEGQSALLVSMIETAASIVAARQPVREALDIIMTTEEGEAHIVNVVGSSVRRGPAPMALDFAIIDLSRAEVVRVRGAELFLERVVAELSPPYRRTSSEAR